MNKSRSTYSFYLKTDERNSIVILKKQKWIISKITYRIDQINKVPTRIEKELFN